EIAAPAAREVNREIHNAHQWEMVVPRMVRPAAAKSVEIDHPKPSPAQQGTSDPQFRAPGGASNEPLFGSAGARDAATVPWKWAVIAMAVLGIVTWSWVMLPVAGPTPKATAPNASPSWVSQRAMFVVGSKEQRQLLTYRGSRAVSDFGA